MSCTSTLLSLITKKVTMLKSTDLETIVSLHTALRNMPIRSSRKADATEKASVSLLAYFKAVDPSQSVATLEQLINACQVCGMIEKPLQKVVCKSDAKITMNSLFKHSAGFTDQQIKVSVWANIPKTIDALRLHKEIEDNLVTYEKMVVNLISDLVKDHKNK